MFEAKFKDGRKRNLAQLYMLKISFCLRWIYVFHRQQESLDDEDEIAADLDNCPEALIPGELSCHLTNIIVVLYTI